MKKLLGIFLISLCFISGCTINKISDESISGIFDTILYVDNNLSKFDKVLEAVGTNESINQSLKLVKTFGKIVLVGNPKENVLLEKNNYWKILRKQLVITGSWNSSYGKKINDWYEVIKYMSDNPLYFTNLISKEFPLESGIEAFNYLMDKSKVNCKVVYKIEK